MPSFRVNVHTSMKGPIFSASATQAAGKRMTVAINENLAQEGVNRVQALGRANFKNPTGFYESQVQVERRQTYRGVWDNRAIYGGWLEGVSSRNQTTRFKGYRLFRRTKQELDRDKLALSQRFVDQYVREMNG